MRLPISEARRRLPTLVKTIQKDPKTTIEITVRNEAVAELRAVRGHPEPGEAVRRLLALRRSLARRGLKSRWRDVSARSKEHLYGPRGVSR